MFCVVLSLLCFDIEEFLIRCCFSVCFAVVIIIVNNNNNNSNNDNNNHHHHHHAQSNTAEVIIIKMGGRKIYIFGDFQCLRM